MKTFDETAELVLTSEPTKAYLTELYKNYNHESIKDSFLVACYHLVALKYLKEGKIDGPGTYRVRIRYTPFKRKYSTWITKVED